MTPLTAHVPLTHDERRSTAFSPLDRLPTGRRAGAGCCRGSERRAPPPPPPPPLATLPRAAPAPAPAPPPAAGDGAGDGAGAVGLGGVGVGRGVAGAEGNMAATSFACCTDVLDVRPPPSLMTSARSRSWAYEARRQGRQGRHTRQCAWEPGRDERGMEVEKGAHTGVAAAPQWPQPKRNSSQP